MVPKNGPGFRGAAIQSKNRTFDLPDPVERVGDIALGALDDAGEDGQEELALVQALQDAEQLVANQIHFAASSRLGGPGRWRSAAAAALCGVTGEIHRGGRVLFTGKKIMAELKFPENHNREIKIGFKNIHTVIIARKDWKKTISELMAELNLTEKKFIARKKSNKEQKLENQRNKLQMT